MTWLFVGVENDLVLASESQLSWLSCRGTKIDLNRVWIEIDMISVFGRNKLDFCVGLGFCVGGRKWLDFGVVIRIDLFLRTGRKSLVLVRASILTYCFCEQSKLT